MTEKLTFHFQRQLCVKKCDAERKRERDGKKERLIEKRERQGKIE